MNEIVNEFLLVGDKFMSEMHLENLVLHTVKELKNFCKQELQNIFTKMILIKLVFNMIWLMVDLNI